MKWDFYVVISLETRQSVLSRYQIGSNLFSDACITHHSAFEVFGYGSQVSYESLVATDKRFSDFEYDGVVYCRIEHKPDFATIYYQPAKLCGGGLFAFKNMKEVRDINLTL